MSTLGGVARSLPVSEWVALSTYPQSRRPPAQEEDEWGLLPSFSKLVLVTTLCESTGDGHAQRLGSTPGASLSGGQTLQRQEEAGVLPGH